MIIFCVIFLRYSSSDDCAGVGGSVSRGLVVRWHWICTYVYHTTYTIHWPSIFFIDTTICNHKLLQHKQNQSKIPNCNLDKHRKACQRIITSKYHKCIKDYSFPDWVHWDADSTQKPDHQYYGSLCIVHIWDIRQDNSTSFVSDPL